MPEEDIFSILNKVEDYAKTQNLALTTIKKKLFILTDIMQNIDKFTAKELSIYFRKKTLTINSRNTFKAEIIYLFNNILDLNLNDDLRRVLKKEPM